MNEHASDKERFLELKAERALFGLSAEDHDEFNRLARKIPDADVDDLDQVVAAAELALGGAVRKSMPDHVRSAVQRTLLSQSAKEGVVDQAVRPAAARSGSRPTSIAPWLFAAACLAFAMITWFATRPVAPTALTAAQLRSELVAEADDLIAVDWAAGPTPVVGASGDVVWSPDRQQGYMRFRKMRVNEPSKEQYQLWIFDKSQSEKTPIDGGVFDISSEGEVVVPIDAKLRADDVYLFAVTVEKPGGVVVSSRAQLPLLAKVE